MQVNILNKQEQKKAYNSMRNSLKARSSSESSKIETINIQTVADKESVNTMTYRNNEQNTIDEGAMKCIYGHIEHGESILSNDQ